MHLNAHIIYKVLGRKHHCLLRTLICWNFNKICRSINRCFFLIVTVLHSNRISDVRTDSALKGKKLRTKTHRKQIFFNFSQRTYSIPLDSI